VSLTLKAYRAHDQADVNGANFRSVIGRPRIEGL
jgi:hypothetical protein